MRNIVEFLWKVIFLALVVGSAAKGAAEDAIDLPAPGTLYTVGDKSLIDPLRLYDQLVDKQIKPKNGITATEACKLLEVWRPVEISTATINDLVPDARSTNRSRLGVFAVDRNVSCIQVGHPVRLALKQGVSGIYAEAGWFIPTGLNTAPAIPTTAHGLLASMAGLIGAMDRVIFVSGRMIFADSGRGLRRMGPKLEGALAISREQIEAAIQSGNFILDVRSDKEFTRSRIKGAINVPYQLGQESIIHSGPESYANQGDRFDLSKVTVAKNQSIVVIGTDVNDLRPRRAALLLVSRGYTRVYYFYEGMGYFQNMIVFPPLVSKQIRILDETQLGRIRADSTIKPEIVDVRSRKEFAAGHIPGAWSSVYYESDEVPFRRRGMSGEILEKVGDRFIIPNAIPTSTHVVIVGRDRYDFAAYKAALALKSSGFSTVYWFRSGMFRWQGISSEHSARFPIARSPEFAQSQDAVIKTGKMALDPMGTPAKPRPNQR